MAVMQQQVQDGRGNDAVAEEFAQSPKPLFDVSMIRTGSPDTKSSPFAMR